MTTTIEALVARLAGFQQGYVESVADADGTLALMHKAAAALREQAREIEGWASANRTMNEVSIREGKELGEARAEISAQAAIIDSVKKRVKGLWETVVAVPRASPGSYDRGRNNGVADTLRAITAALREPR